MKTIEEKIAEALATVVILFAVCYFAGHIIMAWWNGAFAAVTR